MNAALDPSKNVKMVLPSGVEVDLSDPQDRVLSESLGPRLDVAATRTAVDLLVAEVAQLRIDLSRKSWAVAVIVVVNVVLTSILAAMIWANML